MASKRKKEPSAAKPTKRKKPTAKKPAAKTTLKKSDTSSTRIVAIGASAGGLDPFERFFDAMPPNSGLAFVVIQHLSPNFKSMMDELLARHSDMAIHRIEQDTVIEPNAIYLNQARLTPTLSNGAFKIVDTSDSVNPNLPINTFFESLARERGTQAIGVVLSGTGSDGTKGCQAIKNVGGTVLVQEPTSAKFDGMPNSVINKKLADVIAEPERLAQLVLSHTQGEAIRSPATDATQFQSPMEYIFSLIVERYGTDFRCYKPATIERRIRRRYEMCGLNNYQDYADFLSSDKDEMAQLYNDLLIDVTAFFRDGEAFEVLSEKVIAEIGARMSETNQVRIWVPACSSGEEPYSIAMLLADYAMQNNVPLNAKILATDIHNRSLEAASAGVYPEESMKSISSERVGRYFEKRGSYYHISPEIRRLVVFTTHSLFRDPPFTRMDLVSCRNMLIYFKDPAQNKAMALFHFALNKKGYLFLGPSETIGQLGKEFDMVDQRWRIYQKKRDIRLIESTTVLRTENGQPAGQNPFPPSLPRAALRDIPAPRPESRRAFNDALQALLLEYAPPGFVTNRDGQLVHTFGDAGQFISIQQGGFTQNIVDLVIPELKLALSAGLERTKTQISLPFNRRTTMIDANGQTVGVTLKIEGLPDSTGMVDFQLITIQPDAEPRPADSAESVGYMLDEEATSMLQQRVRELERDLSSTEESLQTTIEELETSNEELQATNEELMASNEELQSTNEELHSVNEELYTVSAEHQRKIEELTDLTNDMDQLLKSTEIGTIFLDTELRIRRFTPAATNTFNLIAQDISRPFEHITHNFDEDIIFGMLNDVRENGETVEQELQVKDNHYLVRILPYQPMKNGELELVITIIDITEIREANNRTATMAEFYQSVLGDIGDYVIRWRAEDNALTFCNQAYAASLNRTPAEMLGMDALESLTDEERPIILKWLEALQPGQMDWFRRQTTDQFGMPMFREHCVRAIPDENGDIFEYQTTSRDITKEIKYLESLEALIDRNQFAADDLSARLEEFVSSGCDFLGLEHGLLAHRTGDLMETVSYYGPASATFPVGQTAKLQNSLNAIPGETDGIVHAFDMTTASFAKHTSVKIHSPTGFIGAPVFRDNVYYGSVCFFSTQAPRPNAFSSSEIGFVMLLARWMGYKIERQAQLELVHKNEQELNFIFDNIPVRIWYKDDKNRILRLNQTAADSMGVSVDTAQGADTYDLFPEMAKKYHDDDLAVLNSGKPLHGIIEEYTPLGAERGWVSTDKIPFEDLGDGDRNLLVVSTDVTSLKRQELTLQKLNLDLEQANDGLRQFAYVASHDLQEPLRKIRQFGELLQESYRKKLDEEGRYFLSVVSDSATRMSELISDLLAYSKTSYREFQRDEINLKELIFVCKGNLQLLIDQADGKVTSYKLPSISGDTTMLEQLFTNLIGNAIKYRAPGRPARVKITARTTKKALKILVTDNGIGMDEKYIERIFDPFARLQNDQDQRGSGIGLAICKSVCERHGWEISVSSVLGEGSVFTISIPHDPAEVAF